MVGLLVTLPDGLPFLDKGVNPFGGISCHHITGHHVGGIGVCVGHIHFQLLIEHTLAGSDGIGGFGDNRVGQSFGSA